MGMCMIHACKWSAFAFQERNATEDDLAKCRLAMESRFMSVKQRTRDGLPKGKTFSR